MAKDKQPKLSSLKIDGTRQCDEASTQGAGEERNEAYSGGMGSEHRSPQRSGSRFSADADVIVIGGGASGLMAAGRAAERGKKVLLLEKNAAVGKKLDITGGGRCNVTNAEFDARAFLAHYGEAEPFLYSPLSQFSVQDTFDFFEKRGLPLVVEARKRAFPNTQRALDVTRVLKKYALDAGVVIRTNCAVGKLVVEHSRIISALCGDAAYAADQFIIATGGVSHPETGSTGDGFDWLRELGHTVVTPNPNLVPIKVKEKWVHELSGTSLSFMKISFFSGGKKKLSKIGKILFTHFGLSGPLILNSSKTVGELLDVGPVTATVDMYPDTDFADLEKQTLGTLDANKNKDFKNLLDDLVPHGMDDAVLSLLQLPDPHIKAHSVTKEARRRLVHLLKAMPLTVTGRMGYDRAIVSDGGIPLNEIDTKTMRSKLIENLYLTGDMLNVDRPSGGFSLQLCWTTGFVAGSSV